MCPLRSGGAKSVPLWRSCRSGCAVRTRRTGSRVSREKGHGIRGKTGGKNDRRKAAYRFSGQRRKRSKARLFRRKDRPGIQGNKNYRGQTADTVFRDVTQASASKGALSGESVGRDAAEAFRRNTGGICVPANPHRNQVVSENWKARPASPPCQRRAMTASPMARVPSVPPRSRVRAPSASACSTARSIRRAASA